MSRYCSPEMDAAQRLALSTFDRSVRKRAYARIQSAAIARCAGCVHLLSRRCATPHVADLQNFTPNGISEAWNAQEWSR